LNCNKILYTSISSAKFWLSLQDNYGLEEELCQKQKDINAILRFDNTAGIGLKVRVARTSSVNQHSYAFAKIATPSAIAF
jgi:hypothetical protein